MIQIFRKKPVEIEAVRFDGTVESANLILGWIGYHRQEAYRVDPNRPECGIVIHTLEGSMTTIPGDWIIRGVKGEFYPCKPDIFDATYERREKEVLIMAYSAPCLQCGESEVFGIKVEPTHCFGKGDHTTPGLLGGFICSCPCRNWPNEGEEGAS